MGKHSPGPWRWMAEGDWAGYLVAGDGEGDLVFSMPRDELRDLDEPDARLIAAAPELLDLLRKIRDTSAIRYDEDLIGEVDDLVSRIDGGGNHG